MRVEHEIFHPFTHARTYRLRQSFKRELKSVRGKKGEKAVVGERWCEFIARFFLFFPRDATTRVFDVPSIEKNVLDFLDRIEFI